LIPLVCKLNNLVWNFNLLTFQYIEFEREKRVVKRKWEGARERVDKQSLFDDKTHWS
jgi:hypothetical protein